MIFSRVDDRQDLSRSPKFPISQYPKIIFLDTVVEKMSDLIVIRFSTITGEQWRIKLMISQLLQHRDLWKRFRLLYQALLLSKSAPRRSNQSKKKHPMLRRQHSFRHFLASSIARLWNHVVCPSIHPSIRGSVDKSRNYSLLPSSYGIANQH